MIFFKDTLISDEVFEAQFVCDLNKCKGGCCIDGDCGAPLTEAELKDIEDSYPVIEDMLLPDLKSEMEKVGKYVWDDEFGHVTPTKNNGICTYAYFDDQGIVKCVFEKAYNEGKIAFKKPISCHLYPIRTKQWDDVTVLNYSPRKDLCAAACKLGKTLKVPVYEFLQDSLIRRFGKDYYDELLELAKQYKQQHSKD
jgi:hypothetical protein